MSSSTPLPNFLTKSPSECEAVFCLSGLLLARLKISLDINVGMTRDSMRGPLIVMAFHTRHAMLRTDSIVSDRAR
jgi:hypothetical protein